jgi:hypothetical protein
LVSTRHVHQTPICICPYEIEKFSLIFDDELVVAHLWVKDSTGEWMAMPLAGDGICPVQFGEAKPAMQDPAFIMSCQHSGERNWVLVAGRGTPVWVNGRFFHAGIRILQDRDDVRIHNQPSLFFSTEQLAQVVPFPSGPSPVFCPRCKQPFVDGTPSVQCPRCGLWEHQDEAQGLGCWGYAATCAVCDQLTDLQSGFRWTPSEL